MSRLLMGVLAGATAISVSFAGWAQTAGGQSGYDESLEAISPTDEAVSIGLAGEDPADIARYLLAANGAAGGAQLSPDGSLAAFRWSITGEPQLWIMPAEGGQPTRLTYGNGVTFFRWSPDGESLIYGADNDGNEQEAYYRISADGLTERQVFPAEAGAFRVFGDFGADGETIVFASTARNNLDFDIYAANLETGDRQMIYEGSFANYPGAMSPDGRYVTVSQSRGEDSNDLALLNLANGEFTQISAPERRAAHGSIAWQDDSSSFYLVSNREREYSALMKFDVWTNSFSVIETAEHDIESVDLCGADDRYLVWTVNEGGYSRLHARDLETGETLDTPVLAEGVYGVSCTDQSSRILINVNGWRTPGGFQLWDMQTGEVFETFSASMAGLDADRLVRPEDVRITARDGVELQGLLYLPDDSSRPSDGLPPVVFFVHGGPTAQSRPTFDAVVQYHVDRGMAVFEPNVRGSTGFGHTYVTLDDRENRLESIADLVDMLNWLAEDGRVDAERAAVVGGSYGGYAVNAVLANFPGHFAAGASLYGVADWVTALDIASPGLKASDRIEYGDITEQRWRDYYTENSPIRQADQINVPVLYSHGVMDPRIDIYETEVMVRTLRENGVRADFIRIPDEGHGWRKLSNQLFYYRRQAEFLEEVLGLVDAD
ncbi:alpha/beta hydrolase family protein [Oceanicaulis alexandrii]|uniref:alpha/beta hydrolase family protein n=1 Tax=Oceanicaulis alexandrii TaxID=153233 RepID=UPI0003B37CD1|nr:S9 family peptidase [Oceanicaulis alexandrii]